MKLLTSIIILTLNNLEKTKECLQSIRQFTSHPYELIVVDNGSTDGTVPFLRQFSDIQLICNKENKGFAAGCNQGLRIAKGSEYLLLNNDTIVSHNWLNNMIKALYSNPAVGLAGPLSNMTLPQQMYKYEYKGLHDYHQFALQFNQSDPGKWKAVPILSGFCLLFKKEVLLDIGYLDELYRIGNYEDNDYCYRAHLAGFDMLITADTFVYHNGNSSFKSNGMDIVAISNENRKKFIRKWGINPERMTLGSVHTMPPKGERCTCKARKKIMIFSHICYPHHITGAEKALLFLLDELKAHHEVILVAPNEGMLAKEARIRGIEVIVFNYPLMWSIWQPSNSIQADYQRLCSDQRLDQLIHIFQARQPDLVIANSSVNILPLIGAKKIGIQTAYWIHEVISQNSYTKQAIQLIDQYADWIIGVSTAVLNSLQHLRNAPKCVLFYNSYKIEDLNLAHYLENRAELRKRLGIEQSDKIVATLSSDIVPQKGLDHFIQIAVEMCKERDNAHFLIVGNPTDQAYFLRCLKIVDNSGFKQRFHILPFEPQISKVYPAMDILVSPSLIDEGFGLTTLEGMAYGKPVVAYRSGGLEEVLGTENKKFLIEKGNRQLLKQAINDLLSNESHLNKTGEANRQIIKVRFGLETYRKRLASFLEDIDNKMMMTKKREEAQRFPNGILLKGSSPAVYLLENGQKRHIVNESSFNFFKFKWEKIININDVELNNTYPTGKPINKDQFVFPHGPQTMLAKGNGPTVFLISYGIRYAIASPFVFQSMKYKQDQIVFVSDLSLQSIPIGPPVTQSLFLEHELMDGLLFSAPNGERYFSDQNKLRKIQSNLEFNFFKWDPQAIVPLTEAEFQMLPQGHPIRL